MLFVKVFLALPLVGLSVVCFGAEIDAETPWCFRPMKTVLSWLNPAKIKQEDPYVCSIEELTGEEKRAFDAQVRTGCGARWVSASTKKKLLMCVGVGLGGLCLGVVIEGILFFSVMQVMSALEVTSGGLAVLPSVADLASVAGVGAAAGGFVHVGVKMRRAKQPLRVPSSSTLASEQGCNLVVHPDCVDQCLEPCRWRFQERLVWADKGFDPCLPNAFRT